ncbi:hypothetical protein LZ32DRAFT_181990 [Colletotrichum eremochloae]|nr:hypothetical protein LZ32DRAFT_181990 [Colletotrichum eremochloae]
MRRTLHVLLSMWEENDIHRTPMESEVTRVQGLRHPIIRNDWLTSWPCEMGCGQKTCWGVRRSLPRKTAGKDRPHARPHEGDAVCWMPVRSDGRVFGLKPSIVTNPTRQKGATRRCSDQALLGGDQAGQHQGYMTSTSLLLFSIRWLAKGPTPFYHVKY